jgi:predicted nucleic acid-binding protein
MKEDRAFFDTNVLIYLFDVSALKKREIAVSLVHAKTSQNQAVLSFQVLHEFVNIMRKGRSPKMSVDECQLFLSTMMGRCELVRQSKELLLAGLQNHERYQISWYDALIVAAAQMAGCAVLYSEDLSDQQKYGAVQVVNPFR